MNAQYRKELIDILARESYVERQVTLSSGKTSDYYLDCRTAIFLPRTAFLAGELMLELVVAAGVAQIGGMAVAAIPVIDAIIGAAYRHGVELRGCFVRKETKAHGMQKRIEGAFRPGLKTAVLDDAITTGGSTLEALAALRDAGAEVTNCLAMVDRNEGGREAMAKAGLHYSFVLDASEIQAAARAQK
ncbi:MAG: orotate phosphoribosyltransferase [Candidatus Binataceae bacterium]